MFKPDAGMGRGEGWRGKAGVRVAVGIGETSLSHSQAKQGRKGRTVTLSEDVVVARVLKTSRYVLLTGR